MFLWRCALLAFAVFTFLYGDAVAQALPPRQTAPSQAIQEQPSSIPQPTAQIVAPAAQPAAQPAMQSVPQPVQTTQVQPLAQGQEYSNPTRSDFIRSMIRFGALDLSDENIIDDYALITECEIYRHFFKDEFKWNGVRQAIRKSVQLNIATFPVAFRYDNSAWLGRYDFNARLLRFSNRSVVDGVGTITFQPPIDTCVPDQVNYLPHIFHARLSSPLYIEGIPMNDVEAKNLVKRINDISGTERLVYMRYNLRVISIKPLAKVEIKKEMVRYSQFERQGAGEVDFNVHIDSIEIYEDPEKTKVITIIKP